MSNEKMGHIQTKSTNTNTQIPSEPQKAERENMADYNARLGEISRMKNKDFAKASIRLLQSAGVLNEKAIAELTDPNYCLNYLSHQRPILAEAPAFGYVADEYVTDNCGNLRYYRNLGLKFETQRYVVSNDWYGLGKSGRDNRKPFVNWMRNRLANVSRDTVS
jgi:hypothetical protein